MEDNIRNTIIIAGKILGICFLPFAFILYVIYYIVLFISLLFLDFIIAFLEVFIDQNNVIISKLLDAWLFINKRLR